MGSTRHNSNSSVSLGQIDLNLLGEPSARASVQDIFKVRYNDQAHLVARASDKGSVFDVGTFFEIPRSGVNRTVLRDYIFSNLARSATWQELTRADFAQCIRDDAAVDRLVERRLFADIRSHGVKTHQVGLVDELTGAIVTDPIKTTMVLIKEFPVIKPERVVIAGRPAWDYHKYQLSSRKLLALEHVFRFGNPGGSSVQSRFDEALRRGGREASDGLLHELGIRPPLTPWQKFEDLVYDCQTKYEDQDRHLSWQETVNLSGVDAETFDAVVALLAYCTVFVHQLFRHRGFTLWDIKWEAAVDGDEIVVVDTIDQDSIRITGSADLEGRQYFVHFNKQAIRDYYRLLHPEWYAAIAEAKRRSRTDLEGRRFMDIYSEGVTRHEFPEIPPLDPEYAELQAEKYDCTVAGLDDPSWELDPCAVEKLVRRELDYYARAGKLADFQETNSIARK